MAWSAGDGILVMHLPFLHCGSGDTYDLMSVGGGVFGKSGIPTCLAWIKLEDGTFGIPLHLVFMSHGSRNTYDLRSVGDGNLGTSGTPSHVYPGTSQGAAPVRGLDDWCSTYNNSLSHSLDGIVLLPLNTRF